ncbi:putative sexual development protein [Ilyonectria robusta]
MSFKLLTTLLAVIYGIFGAYAKPLCSDSLEMAGGGMPNNTLPAVISEEAKDEIQIAQFIKNLQVAFLKEGLANITKWDISGYGNNTVEIVNTIAAVRRFFAVKMHANISQQETVHLESFKALLDNYGSPVIPLCNYSFPVSSTEEFFELAHFLGSAGIGSTIGLSERLAVTDPALIRLFSSILAVESRHDAFFRSIQGRAPSAAPFDTGGNRLWTFNGALAFVAPGSCPYQLPVPITPRVASKRSAPTSLLENINATSVGSWDFGWDPAQHAFVVNERKELMVGWVNQVNAPVYTLMNVTEMGKGTAEVPQGLTGIVYAVVTVEEYNHVNDLALGAIAGPAVISI